MNCLRCNKEITGRTKNAKYCINCSYVNKYADPGFKAEVDRIWKAIIKLSNKLVDKDV